MAGQPKDADLGSDHEAGFLYLTEDNAAMFEIEPIFTETGVGAGGPTYRMRAYDGTLTTLVWWDATTVDSGGASYAGPGPLSDVVVAKIVGA